MNETASRVINLLESPPATSRSRYILRHQKGILHTHGDVRSPAASPTKAARAPVCR